MVSNSRDDIQSARQALASLDVTKQTRRSALKELVSEIAEDVHERMNQGFTIPQIVAQLNSIRDEDNQINEQTFRSYLQSARREKNLEPVQKRREKTKPHPARSPSKKKAEARSRNQEMAKPRTQPKDDSRQQSAAEFRYMDKDV